MSPTERLAALLDAEYALLATVGDLNETARLLAESGIDGASDAAKALQLARKLIQGVVEKIDAPLTQMAQELESEPEIVRVADPDAMEAEFRAAFS